MQTANLTNRELAAATRAFSTATVAVSSLYLAPHSVIVTLIGTWAVGLLTCWALWLARREHVSADHDRRLRDSRRAEG